MREIRWGIIGCGDVTEVKSGPGFQKAAHSRLVAVMRRDGARAEDYARRHGVPRWSDDAEAILGAPDIDAVYVATRPDSHADYVRRAAAAGKAVYVEKPMALDHAEGLAMIATCEAAGVPLFVAYYRRAMPYLLQVRHLLAEAAIGRVLAVRVTQFARPPAAAEIADGRLPWRLDPAFGRGGLFFETACHAIDALDFLFGPIDAVHGFAANRRGLSPAADTVAACWRFADGTLGSGTWAFAADRADEGIEVIGSDGSLTFHPFTFAPITLVRRGEVERFAIPSPAHVQQPLIQTIVDELLGLGTCPSTGRSAARTAAVVERILADSRP
ncbi:Gfo/Idh/MocA family oxidoreductase [Siculibacillus lacustris]|uniref:Gfo/Idh/MocA family oxidoreductase n=1 Tax=Siculibacillus lacustris TaxID=1549641 RepID=A0A4Q9VPG8_9HYPH|nr:Gfo/Idh/MocA family oxidoreductase [Siculibacillus lacustris]TBW37621.1 Gfo/Idh/MocA family oxidoreductase [Siculibacillus lacustris]